MASVNIRQLRSSAEASCQRASAPRLARHQSILSRAPRALRVYTGVQACEAQSQRLSFTHDRPFSIDPRLYPDSGQVLRTSRAIEQVQPSHSRLSQSSKIPCSLQRVSCPANGARPVGVLPVSSHFKNGRNSQPLRGAISCKALPFAGPPAEATAILAITSIMGLLATLPGLLMIHGGLARVGSVRSTVLSHFLSAALVAVLWSVCAYSVAFSTQFMSAGTINMYSLFGSFEKALLGGVDVGTLLQHGSNTSEMLFVLHSMHGAIAAACIMLGGLFERIKLVPRIAMVAFWTLLVYCPITHAVSAGPGSLLGDLGVVDVAGSLALHLAPAVSALTAMKFCGGPGAGEGVHNVLLTGIGFAFLWVGWLAHCAGAAAAGGAPVATVVLNAQLSTSMSALVWSSFDGAARCPSLVGVCFGALSGLVAIMPACSHLNCFGALTTGFLAGFFAWLLKGPGGEPVKFPRVVAVASMTGCLSAGLLSHPLFGGAQSSVVFSTQAVVQAISALLVAAWASLGTMVCIGVVIILFRKVLLPEGVVGSDVELVR